MAANTLLAVRAGLLISNCQNKSKMITDNDPMPYGKHKGEKMINVPAHYLIWLLENDKCSGDVKKYIEENKDVLKTELNKNKK